MSFRFRLTSTLLLSACASVHTGAPSAAIVPRVDYHQHLVSPGFAPVAKRPVRDGRRLLGGLDAGGSGKALVLSVGYSFAGERKKLPDPDGLTREENDWTSGQVEASGGR